MNRTDSRLRTFTRSRLLQLAALSVTAFCLLFSVASACFMLAAKPEFRVQFVPDDTFYYLTLARHFAESGRWTFDGGVSVTTGFHPLHAYALASLAVLGVPGPETLVKVCIAGTYAIVLLLIGGVAMRSVRNGRLIVALLLALFVFSRNVSLNSTSGVEWAWVVLCAACYYLLLNGERPARWRTPLVFAVCFVGSLARTDFPLLPFAVGAVGLAARLANVGSLPGGSLLAGISGAAAGTLFNAVHTLWISGTTIQSSARMKLLWTQRMYGPALQPIANVYRSLFADESRMASALLLCLMGLVIAAGWTLMRRWLHRKGLDQASGDSAKAGVLWLGSLAAVLGYLGLYRMGPAAVQCWYSANLVAPTFQLLVLCSAAFTGSRRHFAFAFVILGLLTLQVPNALHWMEHPEWPHQVSMYRAGCYLRDSGIRDRVGSWNAGIIGYYDGGRVINLDGLVNNAVYPYIVKHDLQGYIDRENIKYIADYPNMFDPRFAFRGGYAAPDFRQRLTALVTFPNNIPGQPRTKLYRVAPRALAAPQ